MQIFIKSSSEAKRAFVVEASTSVCELKAKIDEQMKIPASSQRLIFSGRVLKDSDTLGSIGVAEDATIHLVKSIPTSGASTSSQTAAQIPASSQPTSLASEPSGNLLW